MSSKNKKKILAEYKISPENKKKIHFTTGFDLDDLTESQQEYLDSKRGDEVFVGPGVKERLSYIYALLAPDDFVNCYKVWKKFGRSQNDRCR